MESYIVEDSEIDLGLTASAERNLERYLEIISEVLTWHDIKMKEKPEKEPEGEFKPEFPPRAGNTCETQKERLLRKAVGKDLLLLPKKAERRGAGGGTEGRGACRTGGRTEDKKSLRNRRSPRQRSLRNRRRNRRQNEPAATGGGTQGTGSLVKPAASAEDRRSCEAGRGTESRGTEKRSQCIQKLPFSNENPGGRRTGY